MGAGTKKRMEGDFFISFFKKVKPLLDLLSYVCYLTNIYLTNVYWLPSL